MKKRRAAPANQTVETTWWAAISEDVPPQIYEVGPWRENLRQDLRFIRVRLVPVVRKSKSKRRS